MLIDVLLFQSNRVYLIGQLVFKWKEAVVRLHPSSQKLSCLRSHLVWGRDVVELEETTGASRKTLYTKSVLECQSSTALPSIYWMDHQAFVFWSTDLTCLLFTKQYVGSALMLLCQDLKEFPSLQSTEAGVSLDQVVWGPFRIFFLYQ